MNDAPWVMTDSKPVEGTSIWCYRTGSDPVPGIFHLGNPKAKLMCFRRDFVFLMDGEEARFESYDSWKYLTPPKPPRE